MDEPTARELMGRIRCPILVTQGDEDLLIPGDRGAVFAEATGAELVEFQGAGHLPHARHPVPFNLMLRDFAERAWQRPRRAAALAPRDPPAQARALRLLPDRPRPRLARRRDRARAARAAPRPRDRLARAGAGHPGARALRRAHPPRQPPPRARVAPHRRRGARARAQRLPGVAADGRDPARQLHALPRRRDRGSVRPVDRRRGVGARLLPAREPRAQDRGLRVPDRLRRLAADGRGRRRRGRA